MDVVKNEAYRNGRVCEFQIFCNLLDLRSDLLLVVAFLEFVEPGILGILYCLIESSGFTGQGSTFDKDSAFFFLNSLVQHVVEVTAVIHGILAAVNSVLVFVEEFRSYIATLFRYEKRTIVFIDNPLLEVLLQFVACRLYVVEIKFISDDIVVYFAVVIVVEERKVVRFEFLVCDLVRAAFTCVI